MTATRASSSSHARKYRKEGHDNALLFAQEIGMSDDYLNDKKAKKDVIDPSGDAHSVKSGKKKWQIFLYGRNRFITDDGFQALNGVGGLLIHCIDAFPPTFNQYKQSPMESKIRLQIPMRELKDRFQRKALLRAFLAKAIFNSGEVDYLTIFHSDEFHVFYNRDVVNVMGEYFEVGNSVARISGQLSDQKVLFRYQGYNVGELEMRNDSPVHYQQVRFNMNVIPAIKLLFGHIPITGKLRDSDIVIIHGTAIKKFGRWK